MPGLSVCLITQNQASRLPAVLAQASALGEEVVVVDGGSTDETASVAARYPKVRFFTRPFEGNFAVQKNFAFDQARGEWILSLDTDELLGPNAVRMLPYLLRSPFKTVSFPRYWLVDENPPRYLHDPVHYPSRQLRLFRNVPELRYPPERPVHEKFPEEARRPYLRLYRAHLLHYALIWLSEEERREKIRRYTQTSPGFADLHQQYLFDKSRAKLRPCREAWVDGRPVVASPWDFWKERARVRFKSLGV